MGSSSASHTGKRRRTTSDLTAQQVQHKRELDRKAQRALRDRTKAHIQDLEDDLTRIKASRSQSEQAMFDEIQALREENRHLKSCLESIGQFAADGLAQTKASQPTPSTPMDEIFTELVAARTAEPPRQGVRSPREPAAAEAPAQSSPHRASDDARSPRQISKLHNPTFANNATVIVSNSPQRSASPARRPVVAEALPTGPSHGM